MVEELKSLIQKWVHCLRSGDPNCIVNQLEQMLEHTGHFKILQAARENARRDKSGRIEMNVMFFQWVRSLFFEWQIVAIRRLQGGKKLSGAKGEYSLGTLLEDIRQHSAEFNRKEFFEARGLEYDLGILEKEFYEPGCRYVSNKFELSENCHKAFDWLADVDVSHRSPNDFMKGCKLKELQAKLDKAGEDIIICTNKMVAHAATEESRQVVGDIDGLEITLGTIENAQVCICQVTKFLLVDLFGENGFSLRGSHCLDWEHFDEIFNHLSVDNYKNIWDGYMDEVYGKSHIHPNPR